MTEREVEDVFARILWAETDGKPMCVHCACPTVYEARRPSGALRFRCKACRKDFSLTSNTLFAFHKLPLRTYLAAIVIFCKAWLWCELQAEAEAEASVAAMTAARLGQLRGLGSELGLDPSSRTRFPPAPEPARDGVEEYFR